MEVILYFFRDKITGIHYIMYAFGCYFLMFSIIGYLFKQKYLKVEVKLNTSKTQVEDSKDLEINQGKKKDKKNKGIKDEVKVVQTPVVNQTMVNPVPATPQVVTQPQMVRQPSQLTAGQVVTPPQQVVNQTQIQPQVIQNQQIVKVQQQPQVIQQNQPVGTNQVTK